MATWDQVVAAAPELAEAARASFEAHRHKTMASLRKDGSPRISGIEARFAEGELWLGMMQGSLKARDLQHDPRLALHSASVDPPDDPAGWPGDAKIAGRAVEITEPAKIVAINGAEHAGSHLFRVDISEVVVTRIGDPPDHLVIEHWRAGQGARRIERR